MARACVAATTLGSRLYVLGGKDTWGKETTGVSACATGVAFFVSGWGRLAVPTSDSGVSNISGVRDLC